MSARKAIQDAYTMRITWDKACEIAEQVDSDNKRLKELVANLLADEDMEKDHGWSCKVCPRAKLVKSRKHECDFSDCAENFINKALKPTP